MRYFLKFKHFDKYSTDDLEHNKASFALFEEFKDQQELIAKVDSTKLKAKYGDNSLTDDNVIEIMREHIKFKYLLFCMALYHPMTSKRMKVLWNNYSKNCGFVIVYSVEKVIDFLRKHNKQGAYNIRDVEYVEKEMYLTDYFDCLLEVYGKENVDEKLAFNEFSLRLRQKGCNGDQIRFMSTKTKYEHFIEQEIRIIKILEDEKLIDNHCSKQFVIPDMVYILSTSGQECIMTISSICRRLRIKCALIGPNETLKLN